MTDARVAFTAAAAVGPVRRRTFGSFVEHLGRCVYGGIHEPGHPTADEDGFRGDVMDLVRELGTSTIRYPGGNFVSGYKWEDGIGPVEDRPTRLDLAWHSTETNEVGLDEFARWCRRTGHELMLAVNLGTRGVAEALDVLEYANHPGGTAWSDLRIQNGTAEPHGIRMWCLGNEMDGPWQVGHRSAEEYGSIAAQTAAAMKMVDPSLELVACGSSSSQMPTFGAWERTVLEKAFDHVDYVSCHAYYQIRGGDLETFLASSLDMDYFIDEVVKAADEVALARGSEKRIQISFDEWNVWLLDEYEAEGKIEDGWPVAPRLLEDVYTVADAVVVGSLLITLLRRSDRVQSASLAQLVNVIAPIMTEPGGPAWRQTTFHPFATTSRLAQGEVLRPSIDAGSYANERFGDVPLVDAVATYDASAGRAAVFLVNRSVSEPMRVEVALDGLGLARVAEVVSIHDEDPFAQNTREQPERVTPRGDVPAELDPASATLTVTLPPLSWTAVALER